MKKSVLAITLLSALAGCTIPGIGDKQADTPPRITVRNAGEKTEYKTWDNPGLFGPVPESLKPVGAQVCGSLNTDKDKYVALGYHAKAEDVNGNPFPNGGYYCVPDDKK
mgnify:CR=1 FL=1